MTNSRGQSLVQVLISVAIMSITGLIFATMTTNQQRESSALEQKLAALDQQRTLTGIFNDGSVCQYTLTHPTPLTFDSTNLPQTIDIGNRPIYMAIVGGVPAGNPPIVVAQKATTASPLSVSLKTASIQLQIVSGAAGSYSGRWIVTFDNSTTVRPIVSNYIYTNISADLTTPTAAKISSCQYSTASSGPRAKIFSTPGSWNFSVPANITSANTFKFTVIGGGGGAGAGYDGNGTPGAGGGGGGAVIYYATGLTPLANIPLTVGAGGNGGGNRGQAGGSSSLTVNGVALSATGGGPGYMNGYVGSGGTSSSSDLANSILIKGQAGGVGGSAGNCQGGGTYMGTGGIEAGNDGGKGVAPSGFGAGSGCGWGATSKPGAGGLVLIEWY